MAIDNAKLFNVRIKNKYDSYENWVKSSIVLEAGEIAIAHTTVDVKVDNGTVKHPALLMKVGDGSSTFATLPWLSAKAADVVAACKSEADLTTFVNSVIADAGIATDEAMTALAGRVTIVENDLNAEDTGLKARVTTAEGAIDVLETLVGEDTVKNQIDAAIKALNLEETYEKVGVAAELVSPVSAKADANEAAIAVINNETNGILAQAKAHTNTEVAADRLRLDALEAKFTGNDSVADQIAAAVKEEADRAKAAEEANAAAIKAVSDDYLKTADKTELQDQITANANAITLLTDGADPDKVDSVKDLIDYVDTHGAEVTGMKEDISNNATAIANEVTRATGVEAGHADRIKALEDANAEGGVVAEAIAEAKQAGVNAQATADANAETINSFENIVKEGTVENRITAAQEAAVASANATTKTLEDGAVKDNADAIAAINNTETGILAQAQQFTNDGITALNVSQYAKQTDLEATNVEVAKKANDADLAVIAKTGSTDDLVQGTMTLVFDCGTSTV